MNIVVLVKQVPDSGSERKLDPSDNTVARASADNVINEMDEYAIEEALLVRDAQGGEVTVLTVGPDSATEAIRKALSMGADKAVHVVDEAIHGSDAVQTSRGAGRGAAASWSTTWSCAARRPPTRRCSVMPALLAERLGIPQLSGARKLTVEGGVREDRAADRRRLLGASRRRCRRSCRPGTRSTSRATRRSRGSWRRRRSRWRPCRWPTSASTPAAWAWRTPWTQVAGLRRPPAEGRGREGHRRG